MFCYFFFFVFFFDLFCFLIVQFFEMFKIFIWILVIIDRILKSNQIKKDKKGENRIQNSRSPSGIYGNLTTTTHGPGTYPVSNRKSNIFHFKKFHSHLHDVATCTVISTTDYLLAGTNDVPSTNDYVVRFFLLAF